jgi:anti-sigma regulatory factor (Ser/Thr protein kinase)
VPSRNSLVLRLQPTPDAPATARAAVRDVCVDRCQPAVTADAELLTSELVTNAVVHGTGIVTVAVECDADGVAVAVGDESETRPARRPASVDAVGGRGLTIVARLARAWGVRDGDGGQAAKFVWFCVR